MELIAASRIVKAQQRAQAAAPYARALTRAVSAVATYSNVDHPLTTEPEDVKRAAVADRHLRPRSGRRLLLVACIKEGERLAEKLRERGQGGRPLPRPAARRSASTSSASATCAAEWTGFSDQPTLRRSPARSASALIDDFLAGRRRGRRRRGPHRLHPLRRMVTQEPEVIRLLPLEVVEGAEAPGRGRGAAALRVRADRRGGARRAAAAYVQSRIFNALLQAAASELAARQRAMKSATDNAEELIKKYTRWPTRPARPRSPRRSARSSVAPTPWPTRKPGVSERHDCHR